MEKMRGGLLPQRVEGQDTPRRMCLRKSRWEQRLESSGMTREDGDQNGPQEDQPCAHVGLGVQPPGWTDISVCCLRHPIYGPCLGSLVNITGH